MIISVASGKGGTGKTTVATSLALSINGNVQFLDCDVEEPNAYIFLKPEFRKKQAVSIPVPHIDYSRCDFCGKCAEVCAYNALAVLKDNVLVFAPLCHGCGGCAFICPRKAITETGRETGVIEAGNAGKIQFIHGKLNVGEAMAPPVIRAVKSRIDGDKTVIIDVPPGTSCPVVESLKGSDYCILVTEPTPFGLNDLALAVEVLKKMNIPRGVIVNRCDIGDDEVYKYCGREDIPVLMEIPFKKELAVAYSKGIPIVEAFPEYRDKFVSVYNDIKKRHG